MFGWFVRRSPVGKTAVIATILVSTAAAAVTAVALTNNSSTPTAPPTIQSGLPVQPNCLPDLTYTTRSPGSGNIDNLQTALHLKTDCGHSTKQVQAKRPSDAKWSPDGQLVAFTDLEPGTNPDIEITDYRNAPAREVYITDRAGNIRQVTRLANHGKISQPVWSPDGKQLAFLYQKPDLTGNAIYTIAIDGSEQKQVLAPGSYRGLAWNSNKLLTIEQQVSHAAIVSVATTSNQHTTIANLGQIYVQELVVSADGRYILYDVGSKLPHEIWSFDTRLKLTGKVTQTPRNNTGLSVTTSWHLLYGTYAPEGNGNPFRASNQERIGIHSIDLNTGTDTVIVPDQPINSVDAVRRGNPQSEPMLLLPNFEFVSLGDSYSSGEGAPVKSADGKARYIVGTDTDANKCHRSMGAYPVLTHEAVGKGTGFIFKACSGALIEDFWAPFSQNHNGTNADERPQLDWLNARTKVVTLTIGGNNARFGEVMEYCAQRAAYEGSCQDEWQSLVASAIAKLIDSTPSIHSYTGLFKAIQDRAPNARIIVIGYPRFFEANRDSACYTGYPIKFFYPKDIKWINQQIAALDQNIQERAREFGFTYVKSSIDALSNHELCTQEPWLNGVQLPLTGSLHPNAKGHEAFTTLVLKAIAG